jgi:hypothetical protein
VLHKIILLLVMSIYIPDLYVHDEKISKTHGNLLMNIYKRTVTLIGTNIAIRSSLSVTLDDHVVHDHAKMHHLPHLILRTCKRRAPNNSNSRLEHTNCPLDIHPATLLVLNKVRLGMT